MDKLCAVLPSMITCCLPDPTLRDESLELFKAVTHIGKADAAVDTLVEFGMENDTAAVRCASVSDGVKS